jgi:myo-inositol-1(or 4)-monophosphatase
MAISNPLPAPTLDGLESVVDTVMAESRPVLIEAALTGQHGEQRNTRHEGNFLSGHDLRMHRRYRELLAEWLPRFIYASEEDEPHVIGPDPDPDLVVLVDPLDTSELAVRALHGYTHLLVYSRKLARPIAAIVGDIFHDLRLYTAVHEPDGRDRAYVTLRYGQRRALAARPTAGLGAALITNYSMRPRERFMPLASQRRFLDALAIQDAAGIRRGRIGVDFGSIGLCHIAAGQTDGMIEFAKGFAAWDLLPGHYILHAAGGTVLDLNGEPIDLDYGLDTAEHIATVMDSRRKFVAAATTRLAHEMLEALDQ